jgi:hypothetical protein
MIEFYIIWYIGGLLATTAIYFTVKAERLASYKKHYFYHEELSEFTWYPSPLNILLMLIVSAVGPGLFIFSLIILFVMAGDIFSQLHIPVLSQLFNWFTTPIVRKKK